MLAERSLVRALEEAMINDQLIFLVTQKDAQTDLPLKKIFMKLERYQSKAAFKTAWRYYKSTCRGYI